MTIYQEEMQRKAQRYGCITDYDEADQLLLISHKGVHLTAVNPEGFMFYNSKELTDPESREVFSHLVDDAETVREYVGLYESSPQMKPKDVQNYRKLSEYGDVVFAGMYSQKHGFMFCSWRQSDGGKYLAHGDYSPDYLSSKENFAVRAGLVDNNKLFTQEEAEQQHTDHFPSAVGKTGKPHERTRRLQPFSFGYEPAAFRTQTVRRTRNEGDDRQNLYQGLPVQKGDGQ